MTSNQPTIPLRLSRLVLEVAAFLYIGMTLNVIEISLKEFHAIKPVIEFSYDANGHSAKLKFFKPMEHKEGMWIF